LLREPTGSGRLQGFAKNQRFRGFPEPRFPNFLATKLRLN
jgi:hypothetical protein